MKLIFTVIFFLASFSSIAQSKIQCDSLLNQVLAVSGAFQNVAYLDSLLEVDAQRLANCGSWDAIDQQIMNLDYLKAIVSTSLKDGGEFPTYGDVLDIFNKVKESDLYPAIRLSKETFETIAGKTVDWDNLEYDKIKIILITEEEFDRFKGFLVNNKFAGEIDYNFLLEQYYETTD